MIPEKYKNYYSYKLDGRLKSFVYGSFNIYQAKNGSIQLLMGNRNATLTLEQVNTLIGSTLYELPDFDLDLYNTFYSPAPYAKN